MGTHAQAADTRLLSLLQCSLGMRLLSYLLTAAHFLPFNAASIWYMHDSSFTCHFQLFHSSELQSYNLVLLMPQQILEKVHTVWYPDIVGYHNIPGVFIVLPSCAINRIHHFLHLI